MKQRIKHMWGWIPFAVFLVCTAIVIAVQQIAGDTLRIVPRNAMICLGIGSLGSLLLWGNIRYAAYKRQTKTTNRPLMQNGIAVLLRVLSVAVFACTVFVGLFVMAFSYQPEHIVTKYDRKMVARVNSFLDEYVTYYQYKNLFFYGKEMGYEYYGSGGRDPLAEAEKREPVRWCFYDLDGNVIDSGSNT